jgi:hypothetical protein
MAEQENAFDEAVREVDGIVHTASPFHFKADDPNGCSFEECRKEAV